MINFNGHNLLCNYLKHEETVYLPYHFFNFHKP